MEGFLEKKSPVLVKGWQKRYFILTQGYLLYFKTKVRVELPPFSPQGVIPISEISKVDYLDPQKNELRLSVGNRQFDLRAESREVKEQWLDALKIPFDQEVQKGKGHKSKISWDSLSREVILAIYLEREENLNDQILALYDAEQKQIAVSKNIDAILKRFGNSVNQFVLTSFFFKNSKKMQNVQKRRWFVIFSSINLLDGAPIGELASYVPPIYTLDTFYIFKYESPNDRTTYTSMKLFKLEFKPKAYEISQARGIIDSTFSLQFTYEGQVYRYYFQTVSDLNKMNNFIVQISKSERRQSLAQVQQQPKQGKSSYQVSDPIRTIRGTNPKAKTIQEGQLEKKINSMQWKNAVVTLKDDALYWILFDSDTVESIPLFKVSQVQIQTRTITIYLKEGGTHLFKSASVYDSDQWYNNLLDLTDTEIQQQTQTQSQRQTITRQSTTYMKQSINRAPTNMRISEVLEEIPQEEKPKSKGFLSQLFCFGGERTLQ